MGAESCVAWRYNAVGGSTPWPWPGSAPVQPSKAHCASPAPAPPPAAPTPRPPPPGARRGRGAPCRVAGRAQPSGRATRRRRAHESSPCTRSVLVRQLTRHGAEVAQQELREARVRDGLQGIKLGARSSWSMVSTLLFSAAMPAAFAAPEGVPDISDASAPFEAKARASTGHTTGTQRSAELYPRIREGEPKGINLRPHLGRTPRLESKIPRRRPRRLPVNLFPTECFVGTNPQPNAARGQRGHSEDTGRDPRLTGAATSLRTGSATS